MRVQRGGSEVRRRVAWVWAWPENVGAARRWPAPWGASELSNTFVSVYSGHKLEKGYKEEYTPLI